MGSEWAQNGPRMGVEWERHWMAEATRRRRKLVETALNGQGRVLFILNILTDAMKVVWTCKYCIWRACFPHIAPCYEQALLTLLAFKVVQYFNFFRQEFIISLTINVPENTLVKYYYVYR